MAVLHKKEEKIQAVLGRLPKKYTDDEFVNMFIKLYSKDWGKIKSAYIKQSQDKEPGTVVNMPKPDLYLKQVLDTYLRQRNNTPEEIKEIQQKTAPVKKTKATVEEPASIAIAKKPTVKKKAETAELAKTVKKVKAITEKTASIPAKKTAVKKKTEAAPLTEVVKKTKTTAKK